MLSVDEGGGVFLHACLKLASTLTLCGGQPLHLHPDHRRDDKSLIGQTHALQVSPRKRKTARTDD